MRRAALVVFVSLLTLPLHARNLPGNVPQRALAPSLKIERLSNGAEVFARLRSQIRGATGVQAIVENRSSRAVVIPAAGNASGAGGEHFQSDVTLVNYNDQDQNVVVVWVPNGNPDAADFYLTSIPARPPFTVRNFVGEQLGTTGIGSLTFIPVTATGDFDPNGALDAYSRIWTPQPNNPRGGSVSQPFAGVDFLFMHGEYEAIILGLRQDADFRTNFGIVNNSDVDITFLLTVIPDATASGELPQRTVTVPSGGMILQSIPAGSFGPLSLLVNVTEDIANDDFAWIAFASSTDNVTGDGWVSLGAKPFDDDDLDTME